MSLQKKMDAYKRSMQAKAPPEALEIMHRATEALNSSGILGKAVKVGEKAPSFELDGAAGTPFTLGSLLADGPLVVTFYRGKW